MNMLNQDLALSVSFPVHHLTHPHIVVCHPEMFGKLVHLGFDAILISAVLAGVKRSTGLRCVLPLTLATPSASN
jgi:hypothetical protein